MYIYYHYRNGKITANKREFNREDLIGKQKISDMNDKDTDDSAE